MALYFSNPKVICYANSVILKGCINSMKSEKPSLLSVDQLVEALEERQNPERRQSKVGVPEHIEQDRRVKDRRASTTSNKKDTPSKV